VDAGGGPQRAVALGVVGLVANFTGLDDAVPTGRVTVSVEVGVAQARVAAGRAAAVGRGQTLAEVPLRHAVGLTASAFQLPRHAADHRAGGGTIVGRAGFAGLVALDDPVATDRRTVAVVGRVAAGRAAPVAVDALDDLFGRHAGRLAGVMVLELEL